MTTARTTDQPSLSLDLLRRLVGFNTVSDRSNLDLMRFVERYLVDLGFDVDLLPDSRGSHANLWATLGPRDQSGLVLSGHTDVVPVQGQAWTSDPFKPILRDGCLYGRGATDMKGFLACVLAASQRWAEKQLTRPIHIAFSYDEEIGCRGVPYLLDHMEQELGTAPLGCIVGEPTRLQLVDGHKGKVAMRCTVQGREGHSALTHQGANAVMAAAEVIAHIAEIGRERARSGPFQAGFEPPYTTASVGRIEGGSQLNIIPKSCRFEFEFRSPPGDKAQNYADQIVSFAEERVLPALRTTAPESEITFETIINYPGFSAPPHQQWLAICAKLTGTPIPQKVSYGTEAGHFAKRGIPVIVCGPGDMSVAHRPDEHIEVSQLAACDRLLDSLIAEVAA